jgi:hypothetical protein
MWRFFKISNERYVEYWKTLSTGKNKILNWSWLENSFMEIKKIYKLMENLYWKEIKK